MCRRIDCPRCGRPTFAGCGAHVEQVLGDVPRADRCHCHEEKTQTRPSAERLLKTTWLEKIFGK